MPTLKICLLGPPQISYADTLITRSVSQKALGLLAYLAVGPPSGYEREHLAGLFWGETSQEHANFNLRRALWSLRKFINPPGAPHDTHIGHADGRYFFDHSSDYWLDVETFDCAVNRQGHHHRTHNWDTLLKTEAPAPSQLIRFKHAVRLYRGEFIAGCSPRGCPEFVDWLFRERDRLKRQYIEGLRAIAEQYLRVGDHREAITNYKGVLEVDPLDEATHRDLLLAYYMTGARDEALNQYHTLRRLLRQQLDLAPPPEIRALYQDIRNGASLLDGQTYAHGGHEANATRPTLPGPFVGRNEELGQLHVALEAALEGRGCLAAVLGEAGVGKTRLVEEFLGGVTDPAITILRAHCYTQQQNLPYQPIIDALRTYLPVADFDHLESLSSLWLTEVAKLLPELHSYLPNLLVSPALFPSQERNRLFEGVVQFLTHLSCNRPLVLFLDDFHAADELTLDLIHYSARRLVSSRTLILCALRQASLPDIPRLADLLHELDRDDQLITIPLLRLSVTEVVELAQLTLGTQAISEDRGRQLYLQTGGNPFFLIEILKSQLEEPRAVSDGSIVPPTVHDVVEHRVYRLGSEAREVLSIAAVIGRSFNSTVLREVYSGDEHNLLNSLDSLLSREWIVELAGGAGTYDFSHGLVREAVYQMLRPDWRRYLHHRVGEALETMADDSRELAGTLALHFAAANHTHKALRYSLQAAARDRRLYANRQALTHYQRALEIGAQTPGILSNSERLEVQRQVGRAHQFLGEYDAAIAVYKAAQSDANGTATDHRKVRFDLATAYDLKGEYDQALACLSTISNELARLHDSATKLEAAKVARGRARVYQHREQSHSALAFCQQALALLGSIESENVEGALDGKMTSELIAVYEIMANSYLHLGNYAVAADHYQKALKRARKQARQPSIARLLVGLGRVERRLGHYTGAAAHARQSLDLCQEIGHVAGEAAARGLLGDVAYHCGDFQQAIACYQQALVISRQLGDLHGIADHCLSLAFVEIDQNKIDEAENYLLEALSIGEYLDATLVLARAYYHLARVERVRGHLDKAQATAEQAIEAAERTGLRLLEAMGHHLLGDILVRRRQPAQGEIHVMEGLRMLERLGDRFEIACILRTYARLLAGRGDLPHARAHLLRAVSIYTELTAQRELSRTQSELARLHINE